MHRRIPKSRRHKKLKSVDPENKFKHLDKKNAKYDEKPADINSQEVPRKLKELMSLSNKVQNTEKKKKKRKGANLIRVYGEKKTREYGMSKPLKSGPESVTQKPYETDEQFVNRVSRMADVALNEVKMEIKYGIKVNYETTKAKDKDNQKLLALMNSKKDEEKVSKKKLKRKLNNEKKAKKSKKKETSNDFAHLNDEIQFNEVVNEPPSIPQKNNIVRKPGKSDLLLKSLLPSNGIDLKGKRKDLPIAERRKIDMLRDEVVKSYREMKKKKQNSNL